MCLSEQHLTNVLLYLLAFGGDLQTGGTILLDFVQDPAVRDEA